MPTVPMEELAGTGIWTEAAQASVETGGRGSGAVGSFTELQFLLLHVLGATSF